MSEFRDWGEEPPQEAQEITPEKKTPAPEEPPRGWRPSPATIRAIQGLPPETEESTLPASTPPPPESSTPDPIPEK